MPLPKLIAAGAQFLIVAAGCFLFWRYVASRRARTERPESLLPPWNVPPVDLVLFVLHVLAGAFLASALAGLVGKAFGFRGDHLTILATAASHLGIMAGVGVYARSGRGYLVHSPRAQADVVTSGLATFCIALPFLLVVALLWTGFLQFVGLPVKQQLAVEVFLRLKSGPWMVVMAVTAVVIAPITEELVFRAGLFRYVRTRLPRWAALILPSCLFAAMHMDLTSYAQLAMLGVIFSIAYERTGRIGTSIVAHAAFNLNMLVLLFAGVTQ